MQTKSFLFGIIGALVIVLAIFGGAGFFLALRNIATHSPVASTVPLTPKLEDATSLNAEAGIQKTLVESPSYRVYDATHNPSLKLYIEGTPLFYNAPTWNGQFVSFDGKGISEPRTIFFSGLKEGYQMYRATDQPTQNRLNTAVFVQNSTGAVVAVANIEYAKFDDQLVHIPDFQQRAFAPEPGWTLHSNDLGFTVALPLSWSEETYTDPSGEKVVTMHSPDYAMVPDGHGAYNTVGANFKLSFFTPRPGVYPVGALYDPVEQMLHEEKSFASGGIAVQRITIGDTPAVLFYDGIGGATIYLARGGMFIVGEFRTVDKTLQPIFDRLISSIAFATDFKTLQSEGLGMNGDTAKIAGLSH